MLTALSPLRAKCWITNSNRLPSTEYTIFITLNFTFVHVFISVALGINLLLVSLFISYLVLIVTKLWLIILCNSSNFNHWNAYNKILGCIIFNQSDLFYFIFFYWHSGLFLFCFPGFIPTSGNSTLMSFGEGEVVLVCLLIKVFFALL